MTPIPPLDPAIRARMIAAALAARPHAHAPYSGFAVAACLLGDSGRLHLGVNVENAAYPQSQCAEATAIGALVTAGDRRAQALVLVAGGPVPCPPCGGCRQRLAEFAAADLPILLVTPDGTVRIETDLGQLLPMGFGRRNLSDNLTGSPT